MGFSRILQLDKKVRVTSLQRDLFPACCLSPAHFPAGWGGSFPKESSGLDAIPACLRNRELIDPYQSQAPGVLHVVPGTGRVDALIASSLREFQRLKSSWSKELPQVALALV